MIITREIANEIRQLVKDGITQKSIADDFGVHFTTINKIIRNRSFRISDSVVDPRLESVDLKEIKHDLSNLREEIDDLDTKLNAILKFCSRIWNRMDGDGD
jgi:transcriptional regulator with XRE-family HTH domain